MCGLWQFPGRVVRCKQLNVIGSDQWEDHLCFIMLTLFGSYILIQLNILSLNIQWTSGMKLLAQDRYLIWIKVYFIKFKVEKLLVWWYSYTHITSWGMIK